MSRTETRPNPHEAAAGPDRSRRDSRSRHHPGARIGRLTVIERAGYSGKSLRWRCHCDFGRLHRGWSVERTLSAPCQAEYRRPRRAG